MSSSPQDEYLERVKTEIRAEAERARVRDPLPRHDPPPRATQARRPAFDAGIERERLDYAIGELTGPHYRAFLDQAFRAVLKRPPDEAGSELQIRLLAAGASKAEVLGNLRWSPEGRRVGTRVRGLLPRYALAKLVRVPLLGYFVEWGLAFAGLPLLLRHQRAADTSSAARFGALDEAQANAQRMLDELRAAHAALDAEHDRRSDALRADIDRMLLRLDALEEQARGLEERARALEARAIAGAHEAIELRHYVHAANHWVTSLQRSLDELEETAASGRERADALAASIDVDADEATARDARHASWSAVLATRLPADAHMLDLDSGDGSWLAALAARGIAASGVEANAALVARAQQQGLAIAVGDPLAVLLRCADGDLDGLSLSATTLAREQTDIAALLVEARRVLKPGGHLLLRCEHDPHRLVIANAALDAAQHSRALLVAAGFVAPKSLPANRAFALLAQRPAA
ncbi:MAG: methyltransferase domain-containing protein [Dokdonella sp.]